MRQANRKGVSNEARLGEKGNPLWIMQEIEILLDYQIV